MDGGLYVLKLIAECYANKCFAKELESILKKEGISNVRIVHKSMMGRDRILKELIRITKGTNDLVIAVIDYEEGQARVYIEKQFDVISVIDRNILWEVNKQKHNLRAIIFDPNIEDALLCRINRVLCRDPIYYKKIKSSEACKILMDYFKDESVQKIFKKIVMSIKLALDTLNTPNDIDIDDLDLEDIDINKFLGIH